MGNVMSLRGGCSAHFLMLRDKLVGQGASKLFYFVWLIFEHLPCFPVLDFFNFPAYLRILKNKSRK